MFDFTKTFKMDTNQNDNSLNTLHTLSIEDACIFKFFLLAPPNYLLHNAVGSQSQQKELIKAFEDYPDLQKACQDIKRQTFRSKASKMADLAAAYEKSGMKKKDTQAKLPAKVRDANIVVGSGTLFPGNAKVEPGGRPIALMHHLNGQFFMTEYSRNEYGHVVPVEVQVQVNVMEVPASFESLKYSWEDDNTTLKVEAPYCDPMNYPVNILQLFRDQNGRPIYDHNSALHNSFEENVRPRRGTKDGRVWEGFKIKFAQPQESHPVPLGYGMQGFDLVKVPHQKQDGTCVKLNLLIISTKTERAPSSSHYQTAIRSMGVTLSNNWMTQGVPGPFGAPQIGHGIPFSQPPPISQPSFFGIPQPNGFNTFGGNSSAQSQSTANNPFQTPPQQPQPQQPKVVGFTFAQPSFNPSKQQPSPSFNPQSSFTPVQPTNPSPSPQAPAPTHASMSPASSAPVPEQKPAPAPPSPAPTSAFPDFESMKMALWAEMSKEIENVKHEANKQMQARETALKKQMEETVNQKENEKAEIRAQMESLYAAANQAVIEKEKEAARKIENVNHEAAAWKAEEERKKYELRKDYAARIEQAHLHNSGNGEPFKSTLTNKRFRPADDLMDRSSPPCNISVASHLSHRESPFGSSQHSTRSNGYYDAGAMNGDEPEEQTTQQAASNPVGAN